MRTARFAFCVALLLLAAGAAQAAQLHTICSVDRDEDIGVFTGITIITWDSDDPLYVAVAGIGSVSGSVENSQNFFVQMEQVNAWNLFGKNEVDVQYDFELPGDGGCAVGHIFAVAPEHAETVSYDSSQMCWPIFNCQLTDWVNTDGYVTPGLSTGTYRCGICINEAAFPLDGFDFIGWTGDVYSSDPVITICLNTNKSVTGNFTKIQTGGGGQDPGGIQNRDPGLGGGSGSGGVGGGIPGGNVTIGPGRCTFPNGVVVPCG